jgi:hypothetical protein
MQRDEMVAEVRERIGENTPNFWSDAFIIRNLVQGARRFNNEERWHWLYTVQPNIPVNAGNPNVELIDNVPTNRHFALRLTKVGDASARTIFLKRVDVAQGLKLGHRYYQSGEPAWYYIVSSVANAYLDGDTATAVIVKLVPTPDVAYLAEYVYLRDDPGLAADTYTVGDAGAASEPRMPESYHEAVVAWATAKCWLKELNGERKAQSEFNIYNTVLDQARKDHVSQSFDEQLAWGEDDYPLIRENELHRRLFAGGPLGG